MVTGKLIIDTALEFCRPAVTIRRERVRLSWEDIEHARLGCHPAVVLRKQ